MSEDKGVGSLYGHNQDSRAAEGYTANIGPATAPLSTVAFVDATGNPYETNQTEYNRLLKEVADMERKYPDLKGRVNLNYVDQNNMSTIKAAIGETESLVKEKEAKQLQESVMGGAIALAGLGLASEAAGASMGGKSPLGNMFGAEMAMSQQQKTNEEEVARRQPVDPKTEKLLAFLTPQQRERHGVEGGEHVSREALFTPEMAPMQSPNLVAAKQKEQERDSGYSRSLPVNL